MYKLKQIPEDFVVKEKFEFSPDDSGGYFYYKITKKNYNTLDAIARIASALNINPKMIGFAGTKDKVAVTEQYISIKGVYQNKIDSLKLKDITLEFAGKSKERINLGMHKGNEFIITIRGLDKRDIEKVKTRSENIKNDQDHKIRFINYFGEQRFGTHNVEIGKHIIKKDFKQAFELIVKTFSKLPPYLEKYASLEKVNYVEAMQAVPKRLLKLYLAAYQSFLWNEAAVELSGKGNCPEKLPLVGFETEFEDEKIEEIFVSLLKKDKITFRDFIIRQIPFTSIEGSKRDVFAFADNFKILDSEEDELNEGKKKIKINFTLPNGCYATVFIKFLLL